MIIVVLKEKIFCIAVQYVDKSTTLEFKGISSKPHMKGVHLIWFFYKLEWKYFSIYAGSASMYRVIFFFCLYSVTVKVHVLVSQSAGSGFAPWQGWEF